MPHTFLAVRTGTGPAWFYEEGPGARDDDGIPDPDYCGHLEFLSGAARGRPGSGQPVGVTVGLVPRFPAGQRRAGFCYRGTAGPPAAYIWTWVHYSGAPGDYEGDLNYYTALYHSGVGDLLMRGADAWRVVDMRGYIPDPEPYTEAALIRTGPWHEGDPEFYDREGGLLAEVLEFAKPDARSLLGPLLKRARAKAGGSGGAREPGGEGAAHEPEGAGAGAGEGAAHEPEGAGVGAGVVPLCNSCGSRADWQCSCEGASYCSVPCQEKDWRSHKKVCPKRAGAGRGTCGTCGTCGRAAAFECPCGGAFYCSRPCQKEGWRSHKESCSAPPPAIP
jgi:hypothetical protein